MDGFNKEEVWGKVLDEVKSLVSEANFSTWFQHTSINDIKDGVIFINVPNSFTKEWLKNKYNKFVLSSLRKVNPGIKDINYTISNKIKIKHKEKNPPKNHPTIKTADSAQQLGFEEFYETQDSLNHRYSFENFVVGSFNELAHAAAIAITRNIGTLYNPLFVYGGVGLGKTHLLQAIGNKIKTENPKMRIKYTTSERFANGIIESIQNNTTHKFKELYKKYDLLIMDDVQFFAGKTKTREEFFHIFNTLYESNKQIIFSSDRPPHSIPDLEERLRSRFEGGMMTDISEPEYEARVAILNAKLKTKNIDLSDEIIEYIATTVKSNIRELEGALNFLSAQTRLLGKSLNLKEIQEIFTKNLYPKKKITFNKIIKAVTDFYETSEQRLLKKSRRKEDILPRQIAMYLLREDFNASYPYIGQKIGGRDHTTVIHSYEKISEDIKNNPQVQEDIKKIRDILQSE